MSPLSNRDRRRWVSVLNVAKIVHNVVKFILFNLLKSKLRYCNPFRTDCTWPIFINFQRWYRHLGGMPKLTFVLGSPKGCCYDNQLILWAVCRRWNWQPSLFALAFHNEVQYCHRHVNTPLTAAKVVCNFCINSVIICRYIFTKLIGVPKQIGISQLPFQQINVQFFLHRIEIL